MNFRPPGEPGLSAKDHHDRREVMLGVAFIVLSSAIFGAVDGFSKLLADTQSVGQIVWTRYALALPVLFGMTGPGQWTSLFRTKSPGLQIVRGLTPLAISITMVLGVRYMPLAEATVILFAAPFLVVALSAPLLGERVRASTWIAVCVGFLAVVIVARPGFSEISHYAIFPLVAAIFFALLQLITRQLGARGEKPVTTLAWTLLVGCVASTPFAFAMWEPVVGSDWFLMIGLGVVFGFAQLFMARGFAHAAASTLTPFTYVQIIAAVIFGAVVFGDLPDIWSFVGIVMIIGAGIYVVRSRAA